VGFIQESTQSFGGLNAEGFELCRYGFSLTDDGKEVVRFLKTQNRAECLRVSECLGRLAKAGDFSDYVSLSIAAKTFFILKETSTPVTSDEIKSKADQLGWKISAKDVEKAASFLQNTEFPAAAEYEGRFIHCGEAP
jgi:hypothetical protein